MEFSADGFRDFALVEIGFFFGGAGVGGEPLGVGEEDDGAVGGSELEDRPGRAFARAVRDLVELEKLTAVGVAEEQPFEAGGRA